MSRWPLVLIVLAACEEGEEAGGAYSQECKQDATEPIADAQGTFDVTGPDGVPSPFVVGTYVGGTGSLNVTACIPAEGDAILDRLNFDLELVLFDIDDQPIDLPVADDATTVNVLWGTVSDWDEVVDWDEDTGFLHFTNGSSSFSELDKDGRLVGTIDVTGTDPAGYAMTVDLDLSW